MMKKISELNILGQPFSIKWKTKADMAGNYGLMDGVSREIHVQSTAGHFIESTLLHEAIHAILYVTGMGDAIGLTEKKEEGLCLSLENGLVPIIQQMVDAGAFAKKKPTKKEIK